MVKGLTAKAGELLVPSAHGASSIVLRDEFSGADFVGPSKEVRE